MKMSFVLRIIAVLACLDMAVSFQPLSTSIISHSRPHIAPFASTFSASSVILYASEDEAPATSDIESYLNENYPAFMTVLSRNEKACKVLRESSNVGFTVFAPNDKAFMDLGETKCSQLADPRNLETTEKIGAYHVIQNEAVSATALFNAGGVVTVGGDVPIERSVSGGFMGIGGKEDGGVTVNGAKVVKTIEVGKGIVHEMDGLISPKLLLRYLDQLRIPGSK